MSAVSKAQIGAIHSLKAKAGFDDDTYRSFLERETGLRSASQLDGAQAGKVITRLKAISGGSQTSVEPDFTGPYGAISRALWLSAYNLGVVSNRTDAALLAFVRRQTKIDHINWVRDHDGGSAVVDALKKMLARDGGVVWPKSKADSAEARKRAVIAAQLIRLGEADLSAAVALDHLDSTIAALGRRIRAQPKEGA